MAGTISSLGLGSSGTLSADTIEKLKANDEALQIDPIKAKIENTTQQTQAYDLIDSLITSLSGNTDRLGGDLLYLSRTTSVTGDGATVTAEDGVSPQSFTVDVTNLATKDIQESSKFSNSTDLIADSDGIVTLSIDGEDFDIDVTTSTTLEDFRDSINSVAGSKVTASILNVAPGDYRLVVSSDETGDAQDITFTDANSILKTGVDFAETEVQNAVDAKFKYNGIDFTRTTNTITDITVGVSITLLEAGKSATATISQDTDAITSELSAFTEAYNSLFKELTSTTTTDVEKGTVGVFNGENTIKSLSRGINEILFESSSSGNSTIITDRTTDIENRAYSDGSEYSIGNFGFELSQNGTLSFDEEKFKTAFAKDPDGLEKLFKSKTDPETGEVTDGVFKKLDNYLDDQTSTGGFLKTFGDGLNNKLTSLNEEQTRAQELLDARYNTMYARFAAYDRVIAGIEQQFSILDQQIQASLNKN